MRAKIQIMRIRSATCHSDVHTEVKAGAIASTMPCRYFLGICINGIAPFALIGTADDDVLDLLLSLSDDDESSTGGGGWGTRPAVIGLQGTIAGVIGAAMPRGVAEAR